MIDNTGKYDTKILEEIITVVTKKEKYVFQIDNGEVKYQGIQIMITDIEPIMQQRKNESAFWQEEYITKISKIEVKSCIATTEKIVQKWDVSQSKNNSVLAWITDDGNNGYNLYIAGNGKVKLTNGSRFFADFINAKTMDLSGLDTENVTNMNAMFLSCENLIRLDLSKFDTRNVQNTALMFNSCHSIKEINVSSFDTRNVTSMRGMFTKCSSLENLDLRNFNTENVVNMMDMFYGCDGLKILNLSNFKTENVENMISMFRGCTNLVTINIKNFNMENVLDSITMFEEIPTTVKIIANAETATWIGNNFPRYKDCMIIE